MISTPTVLILGAGASAHLDYPIGSELMYSICQLADSAHGAEVKKRFGAKRVHDFLTHMSECGDRSVDSYLARCNGDDVVLGKYLIAMQLKRLELRRNVTRAGKGGGWYQDLFDAVIDGNLDNLGNHRLTVVTFNYDRSLEAYFQIRIAARFGISAQEANQYLAKIPIIHVHGILGALSEFPYEQMLDHETLLAVSSQIKIIHEIDGSHPGPATTDFAVAKVALDNARRIFFLGFGFHEENLRRFDYFSPEALDGKTVSCTQLGVHGLGRRRFLARLEKFGIKEQSFGSSMTDSFFQMDAQLD